MDTISTSPDMLSSPVSATAKAALLSNRGQKLIDYYLLSAWIVYTGYYLFSFDFVYVSNHHVNDLY